MRTVAGASIFNSPPKVNGKNPHRTEPCISGKSKPFDESSFALYKEYMNQPLLTPREEKELTGKMESWRMEVRIILKDILLNSVRTVNVNKEDIFAEFEAKAGRFDPQNWKQVVEHLVQSSALKNRCPRKIRNLDFAYKKYIEARENVMNRNFRLVMNLAKKKEGRGLSLQELFQIGNIGFIRALDKYESSYNSRVATYASWWINQVMLNALAKASTVEGKTYASAAVGQLRMLRSIISNDTGNDNPDERDLVRMARKHYGDTRRDAEKRIEKALKVEEKFPNATVSLDRLCDENETMGLKHILEDRRSGSETLNYEDREFVEFALDLLTKRERTVLTDRFAKELTLEEVGRKLGITRERVRQIEKAALQKIRGHPQTRKLITG